MKLNKKGFTIVELVIVIAVIAILAAVLIPTFNSVITKANESAALQEAKATEAVVILHENGNVNDYQYYYVVYDKDVSKGTTGAKIEYVFIYNSDSPTTFSTNAKKDACNAEGTALTSTVTGTNNANLLKFSDTEAKDVSKKIEVYRVAKTTPAKN